MPIHVVFAVVALPCSVALLWWSLRGSGGLSSGMARTLNGGIEPVDLHQIALSRSLSERALQPTMDGIVRRARRLSPTGFEAALAHRAVLAGLADSWPVERLLAVKVMLGAAGLIAGLARLATGPGILGLLMAAGLTALAYMVPDLILSAKGRERQRMIRQELPDTLDQVTISVDAGLGFEAALARAVRAADGPLAAEIRQTLQDIQLGIPRSEALKRLMARTDVPELRQFARAVAQTETYGVPIAQVLRVQASELREKRRQQAEERAMKIPVKVVLPLISCILPTLFIVVLGPAVIRLMNLFSGG